LATKISFCGFSLSLSGTGLNTIYILASLCMLHACDTGVCIGRGDGRAVLSHTYTCFSVCFPNVVRLQTCHFPCSVTW
jgi:hypothetical protein